MFGNDEDDDADESFMFDKPPQTKIAMPTVGGAPAKKPGLFDDEGDDDADESIMLPPKTKPSDLFGDDPPAQPAAPAEPERPSYAKGPGGDLMAEMMKKNANKNHEKRLVSVMRSWKRRRLSHRHSLKLPLSQRSLRSRCLHSLIHRL